jgi:Flp pilus assembly protein TadD
MGPRRLRLGFAVAAIISLLALALGGGAVGAAQQESSPPAKPDTAEAHVGRGYDALKDERYQEAATEFQAALALAPNLSRARYQLAVCWFALGNMQEARKEFEHLEEQTRGSPGVAYYLARLDLRERNFDSAVEKLASLAHDPPFPDTAYYLATAYLDRGELELAEKWLRVAALADPLDYRVPDHLALVYQRRGWKAEAEKQFEISSQLRKRFDQASQQAVTCSQLLETKPFDKARPACQQLFDPNDADKLTTLGLLYGQHAFYAEAVQPLEKAARLDPDSSEIQHDLGLTYFRLRRYGEARPALDKAVALRPGFFGSNALLGATLYALSQDEEAYRVLSHAYALNPGDRDTASLLSKEALILAYRA